jgi:hypothetical protein
MNLPLANLPENADKIIEMGMSAQKRPRRAVRGAEGLK